jgi:hypothetical protein
MSPRDFIKRSPSVAKIKHVNEYPLDLISVVDQGVDYSRQLQPATAEAQHGKLGGAIAERVTHRSTAARALRCTNRDGENGKMERG